MAIKNLVVSDLSGTIIENGDAIEVTIRHPKFGDKRLDAIKGELDALKTVDNLVTVEVKQSDGSVSEVFATVAEVAKVVPDEVLEKAPGTRGRRPGFSPKA